MMKINWATRPLKARVRRVILQGISTPKRALFLPGNGCLCIRTALELGVIDHDVEIVAVERDPDTAQAIANYLGGAGFTSPEVYRGELSQYGLDRPFDYAFVDLLGPIDYGVARWMQEMVRANPRMEFALTVSYGWRNSSILHDVSIFMHENPEYERALRDLTDIVDPRILYNIAILRSILHGYDFYLHQPISYRDSHIGMLAFRVSDITPNADDWPDLETLTGRKRIMNIKTTDRSAAASKAWDTRRAKAVPAPIVNPRSEAARKAWVTRRAKAAARATPTPVDWKRSEAAHKAWVTRRAKAGASGQ